MHYQRYFGFSLVELLIASAIASAMLVAILGSLTQQIRLSETIYQQSRARQQAQLAFARIERSIDRASIVDSGGIQLNDDVLSLSYRAGHSMSNCLGTPIQAATNVDEYFYWANDQLYCRSQYQVGDELKTDVQPILSALSVFSVELQQASTDCLDAVVMQLQFQRTPRQTHAKRKVLGLCIAVD